MGKQVSVGERRVGGRTRWPLCLGLLLATRLAAAEPETLIEHCAERLRAYSEWSLGAAGRSRLDLATSSGGSLTYLGAVHSLDVGHLQFARIEEVFAEVEPTLVFYEGHDWAIASSREEAIREFGESGFLRFLAAARGIPAYSLEPSARYEVGHLSERFAPEQVQLFFLLRDAARLRDRQGLTEREIRLALEEALARPKPGLRTPIRTLDDLEETFWRYWRYPSRWWEVPSAWFNPFLTSARTGGLFTNEVARASGELRDRHMYGALARAVLDGHAVVAVVGRDHLPMQAPALRCALEGKGS